MGNEISGVVGPAGLDLTPALASLELSQQDRAAHGVAEPRPFIRWLMTLWVDKSLAVVAMLTFVYPIAMHFRQYVKPGETIYLAEAFSA